MAMTKAEKARVEQLETELREAKALRWTERVTPDIPVPMGGSFAETSGYTLIGSRDYIRVEPAWSSCVFHGTGYASSKEQKAHRGSASQKGIALYSTRLLALRAMRFEIESGAAKRLSSIDKMIEDEIGKVEDRYEREDEA
ncbi:hypothetical protein [Paraburkholderia caballeronis]|uniref:hypothetical protein n=1 Tax=Paraburkholderia caballeronis TaxID=416943 RepID=UPI001064CB80|nr:hypothetical protein [Paraburkholderia caballeronis]